MILKKKNVYNAILLSEKKKEKMKTKHHDIISCDPTFYKYTLSEKPTKNSLFVKYNPPLFLYSNFTKINKHNFSKSGMTRIKKKKKNMVQRKIRSSFFFPIRPLFTQLLKTREETLQNIILDLSCFHYLFLKSLFIHYYSIFVHPN